MRDHVEGFADVPGASLHYEVAGEGPEVVLIHPGLWDMRAWNREFLSFSDRFRVLRYDVRGYGRSSFPTEPYSNVEDLAALMDAVGFGRAALVGCSMGGNLEIGFALEHPHRVTALVPVAAGLGGFDWPDEKWEPIWAPIEEALENGDLERATDLCLEIWAPMGTSDEAGARIRQIAMENTQQFRLDQEALEIALEPPPITRLHEIDVPTLIVLGDRDVEEITEIGRLLAAGIPGSRTVVVEDADHVVNMRNPEAFGRAVGGFLDEVTRRD